MNLISSASRLVAACFLMSACQSLTWAQSGITSTMSDPYQIVSTSGIGHASPVFVNIDGDGVPDMLLTKYYDNKLVWHKNLGNGNFGPETILYSGFETVYDLQLGDLNQDDTPDLTFVTHQSHTVYYCLGIEGGGLSIPEPITSNLDHPYSSSIGDFDGDGDGDVVVTSYSNNLSFWLSFDNGEPTVNSTVVSNRSYPTYTRALDLDDDGVDEILMAHNGGQGLWIYQYDASGAAWDETQLLTGDISNEIQIVEVDDVTYVFCRTGDRIRWNDYNETWGEYGEFQIPGLTAFHVSHDSAGFVITASSSAGVEVYQSEDLSSWEMTVASSTPSFRYIIDASDLDLGLVASEYNPMRVYSLPTGESGSIDGSSIPLTSIGIAGGIPTLALQADSDAEQEILIKSGNELVLLNSTGQGEWDDGVVVLSGADFRLMEAADIDDDGDDDVLLGTWTEDRVAWLECLGNGTFSAIRSISLNTDTYDIEWVDVNGDGLMDVVASASNSAGVFVWTQVSGSSPLAFEGPVNVAEGQEGMGLAKMNWADFNNDGKQDVVVAYGWNSFVGIQGASMSFEWTPLTTENGKVLLQSYRSDLQTADINGDGYEDVVFGNWDRNISFIDNSTGDPNDWEVKYFTDNSPTITANINPRRVTDLELIDVDQDGDYEIVSCTDDNAYEGVFAFDVDENWESTHVVNLIPGVPFVSGHHRNIIDMEWGDFDADGDLDLVAVMESENRVYFSDNVLETAGCTDELAVNFDAGASVDDGSCAFAGEPCNDGISATYNDNIQADGSCLGQSFNGESVLRVNCGYQEGDVSDAEGNVWPQDDNWIGGHQLYAVGISGTPDNEIMGWARYGTQGYDLQVPESGEYMVRLHFAAIRSEVNIAGREVFDVILEGDTVEAEFDIFVEAGEERLTLVSKEYFVETTDNTITLRLPVVEFSNEISGIEVFQYTGDCVDLDLDDVCDDLEVFGCVDAEACNFDEDATEDDDTCEYITCAGCTDDLACNYDENATYADASCQYPEDGYDCAGVCLADQDGDGVCDESEIAGCTYAAASNFNPSATDDDGSCVFDGSTGSLGCTYMEACNYDEAASVDDGSCVYPPLGQDCSGNCLNDQDGDGICDEFEGCTIPTACNYNAAALDNDGCCIFPEEGFDCAGNCLSDDNGNGICDENEVPGCTDPAACNYSQLATVDNGICTYALEFEDCEGNCLADSDGDGVCDGNEVEGCADESACNYDPEVTNPDGSCTYPETYYGCDGACLADADGDGVCDVLEIPGCTYVFAANFNSNATNDDGSCVFGEGGSLGCFYSDACNYQPDATEDDGSCIFATPGLTCDGECLLDCDGDGICDEFEVAGCTDSSACNFNPFATDSVDNCEWLSCAGCTDTAACNYNPEAPYEDGSCEFTSCLGCTLAAACNFDVDALIEDGSCEFLSCAGCTYPDADNYNPDATVDDGSCVMDGALQMAADEAFDAGVEQGLLDGAEICEDEVDVAFEQGFELGVSQSAGVSEEACGPGTTWSAEYQLCLPDPICHGDLNEDGLVGISDLLLLLSYFGDLCEE